MADDRADQRGGRHRAPRGAPPTRQRSDSAAAAHPVRLGSEPVGVGSPRPVEPVKPTSRAGRNLPMAIAVGLFLGATIVVPLVVYPPAFVLVVAAAIVIGTIEMVRAVRPLEARPPLVPLLAGSCAMVALAWFQGPSMMVVGLILTIVAVMVWRLGDGPVGFQRDVTAAALIAAYVPFLASFAVLLVAPDDGRFRIVTYAAIVVCSDVGAYAVGVLIGRHKMSPVVSSGKTWEGLAGSLVVCSIAGALLVTFLFDRPWWYGALVGLLIALAATLGDLAESMMKRDLGIKDMGSMLPGHGGLMDRLDSMLVAAPVAYLALSILAPP